MSRTLRGLAVLAIGVGAWACKGDPQSALRGDAVLVVTSPSSLFLRQGIFELVSIEIVDDQGNQLAVTDFTLTSNNAGITVEEDSAFNFVYDAAGVAVRPSPWTRARYRVTGNDFVSTTLTASGGGLTQDIPVRVVPATDLDFDISDLAPPLGDTLTFTAAAGTHFTDSSSVTFASGPTPIVVSVDPTGATMLVLPGPNTVGAATVTNVQVDFDPSLVFTVTSTDLVLNQAITDLGDPFNTTTPALGQTLTMTTPTGFVFQTSSTVTFPDAPAPIIQGLSPDSTVLSMLVAPNMDTLAVVTNVIHERLPQFPLTLFTTVNVVTPVIANVPVTYSNATPPSVQVVRMTAGAGFQFDPTASVSGVLNVAKDPAGTWIDVAAPLGFSGPLSVSGVVASAAPQFLLDLDTDTDLVVGTTDPFTGTDDPTTAPTIVLPTVSGTTLDVYDAGPFGGSFLGFPSRWFLVTVAAPTTYDIDMNWIANDDLGLYFMDSNCGAGCGAGNILDAADSFGSGAGGHPETATITLAAGSYLWVNLNFDNASIDLVRYRITAQ